MLSLHNVNQQDLLRQKLMNFELLKMDTNNFAALVKKSIIVFFFIFKISPMEIQ